MEAEIERKLTMLKINHITLAESQEYNESPVIHHTIWDMRGKGTECTPSYFANLIESSIEATRRSYQIVFEPFAIYYEPIIHRPDQGNYYFCRAHVYTRNS